MIRILFVAFAFLFASPALAVDFPPLTGRVVDQADLLNPAQEAQLSQRLEALEHSTSRQLVVATVTSLQGMSVEDYGYQLGRAWGIGQSEANNGAILLIAPNERKMRIEVGYGLEGIMTDALSGQIIRNVITPHFRANPPDYAGGILAGADAIITQFAAPPEAAEQRALEAAQAQQRQQGRNRGGGSPFPFIIWMVVIFFILLPMIGRGMAGRRYRRGVSVWGPGNDRGSGLGWFLAGVALDSLASRGRSGSSWSSGSSWGGGGSSWGGGGGGGFSGGGGSFGGGGASGGW
jgi:uncharacterized protein